MGLFALFLAFVLLVWAAALALVAILPTAFALLSAGFAVLGCTLYGIASWGRRSGAPRT